MTHAPPPEHAPEPSPSDRAAGDSRLGRVWSALKSGLIAAAVAVILVDIVKDLANATYAIDEPPAAADKPSAPKYAPLLRDAMGRLTRSGYIDSTPQPESVEADQPKFKVADTEFSLGFATTLIRKALGLQIKHISGELVASQEFGPCKPKLGLATDPRSGSTGIFHFTLRASDDGFGPFFDSTGCLDDVIRDGALATLEQVDPVTAAGALSSRLDDDKQAALRLIDATLAAQREASAHGGRSVLPFFHLSLHRALLMKGLVEERMDQHADAAREFGRADDAYRDSMGTSHHWHIAQDSLAYALIKLADDDFDHRRDPAERFKRATEALDTSLKERPDYDSALYHQVMIEDHRVREAFTAANREPPDLTDLCPAYSEAARARDAYATFLGAHPTFTIAHFDWAVMDMQELLFIQGHGRFQCAPMADTPVESTVAMLDSEAGRHLRAAVEADPLLRFTHVQLAYLAMQRQEPAYVHPGNRVPNDAERLTQLAIVRAEVEQALRLGPPDDDTTTLLAKVADRERQLRRCRRRDPSHHETGRPGGCPA